MVKRKINIAYVVLDFKLRGVPIHILDLVKCLDKDKYNPLICCIRERGELAEALIYLIENRDRALEMGQERRRYIQSRYTLKHQSKNFHGLYESILKSKGFLLN